MTQRALSLGSVTQGATVTRQDHGGVPEPFTAPHPGQRLPSPLLAGPAAAAPADVSPPEPAAILGTAKSLAQLVRWQRERAVGETAGPPAPHAALGGPRGRGPWPPARLPLSRLLQAPGLPPPRGTAAAANPPIHHPSSLPFCFSFFFFFIYFNFVSFPRQEPPHVGCRALAGASSLPPRCHRSRLERGRKAISWQRCRQRAMPPHMAVPPENPTGSGLPGWARGSGRGWVLCHGLCLWFNTA